MYTPKVLICSGHQLTCDGLNAILSDHRSLEVIGRICGYDLHSHLQYKNASDVVIIEVCEETPIDELNELFHHYARSKILIITASDNPWFLTSIMHHKLNGCFLASEGAHQLSIAISRVYTEDWYLSSELKDFRSVNHPINKFDSTIETNSCPEDSTELNFNDLTKREFEVLKMIAVGDTSSDIAQSLFISESTVNTHRKHILKKLGLSSTPVLIRCATEQGIV